MNHEVEEKRHKRSERPPPYPIFLRGEGRRALVVGGGNVARRKAEGLLRSGFAVAILAPEIDSKLPPEVTWLRGRYPEDAPGELHAFDLVFAATDVREINEAIGQRCRHEGILVNLVDDPESGDFMNGAMIQVDEAGIAVAVSTAGQAPAVAKRVRDAIERVLRAELSANRKGDVNPD